MPQYDVFPETLDSEIIPEKSTRTKKYGFSAGTLVAIVVFIVIVCIVVGLITYFVTKAAFNDPGTSKTTTPGPVTTTTRDARSTTQKPGPSAEELRLPKNLEPILYNWTVKTYLPYKSVNYEKEKNFTIDGRLQITFKCIKETDVITLNQNGLNFTNEGFEVKAEDDANESNMIGLEKIEKDDETQMVRFGLTEKLEADRNYRVKLNYVGDISGNVLAGIYRSKYEDENGETVWLAATQMEPVDARRALPCFDEPQMKAEFQTTIIHPKGTTALANGKEITEKVPVPDSEGDWLKTTFEKSPKMSTYLLAIAVTNFQFTEKTTSGGTRFRIWARPSMLSQTEYALEAGVRCLEFYEKYYDVPFPMPKQDMIALPDFEAGAMENWGLITYREKYLLYDPNVYALSNKQLVAVVIAHELAHQWFGNLVTMKWWDDLWLNEGFASFMEFIGTDVIGNHTFHMPEQFVAGAIQAAMSRDQLATSHPLYGPVARIQDLYEIFDGISYDKGGSILHMVNNLISSENFEKGLTIYLNRYKYSNAAHNDLWNSLTEAVSQNATLRDWNDQPLNVTNLMASWTLQMGFPVIEVATQSDNKITVKQSRFKLDPDAKEKEKYSNPPFGYKWHVPVWYQLSTESHIKLSWLTPDKTDATLDDTLPNDDDWVLVNPDVKGYYRVSYDAKGWSALAKQLKKDHTRIPVKSRSQLIDDAFTMARGNRLEYETALMMTEYLEKEDNYLGWGAALGNLGYIRSIFESEPGYEYLRKYLFKLVADRYDKTDWDLETDDVFVENLASSIISLACKLDHAECIGNATQRSAELRRDCKQSTIPLSNTCNSIPPAIRRTVYCTSVQMGDTQVWEYFWQKYQIEQIQVEKERILYGLSCTNQIFLLHKLLDTTIEAKLIRKQDASGLWAYISYQTLGQEIIWDYFAENWDRIYETFGEAKYTIKHLVAAATRGFKSDYQIEQLTNWLEAHSDAKKYSIFDLRKEVAAANVKWMKNNYRKLEDWFRNKTTEL